MEAITQQQRDLSKKKIILQDSFREYVDINGYSYEEWINPVTGSFYDTYKRELAEIEELLAPQLSYQT